MNPCMPASQSPGDSSQCSTPVKGLKTRWPRTLASSEEPGAELRPKPRGRQRRLQMQRKRALESLSTLVKAGRHCGVDKLYRARARPGQSFAQRILSVSAVPAHSQRRVQLRIQDETSNERRRRPPGRTGENASKCSAYLIVPDAEAVTHQSAKQNFEPLVWKVSNGEPTDALFRFSSQPMDRVPQPDSAASRAPKLQSAAGVAVAEGNELPRKPQVFQQKPCWDDNSPGRKFPCRRETKRHWRGHVARRNQTREGNRRRSGDGDVGLWNRR